MFLSRAIRRLPFGQSKWLLAAAATFLLAPVVRAQGRDPYIPPDAKGNRAQQIREAWIRQQAAHAQAVLDATPTYSTHHAAGSTAQQPREDVVIRVMVPTQSVVTLRGPDGTVQSFPLASGAPGGAQPVVVVSPGKPATITVKAYRK